jgi:hypothetical protein
MVAHYARADDGSPDVIWIGQLAERVKSSAATTMHPRNYKTTPAMSPLTSGAGLPAPALSQLRGLDRLGGAGYDQLRERPRIN